jgi:hypothetical protein
LRVLGSCVWNLSRMPIVWLQLGINSMNISIFTAVAAFCSLL